MTTQKFSATEIKQVIQAVGIQPTSTLTAESIAENLLRYENRAEERKILLSSLFRVSILWSISVSLILLLASIAGANGYEPPLDIGGPDRSQGSGTR